MKFLVVLVAVFAIALAQRGRIYQSGPDAAAVILNHVYDLNPDGSYIYNYETSNGIRADQQGYLKNPGTPGEAQVIQGSYSYTGPDGVLYTVTYTADENGFRPEGPHLPKLPPINRPTAPGRYNF